MAEPNVQMLASVLERELSAEPRGSGRTELPVAWASTRGSVRTENQDRLAVGCGTNMMVAVLADGMGGMKDGATAATISVAASMAHCLATRSVNPEQILADSLRFANESVFRVLQATGGAVVVLAGLFHDRWYVAHAGDARAYHVTQDGTLKQLTIDDTVKGQFQEQGRQLTQETSFHSQLLQFIGMGKDLEPHVTPVPDGGRGLLLTTDGIHGGMPSGVLEWLVKKAEHLQVLTDRLVSASEWDGGRDNASVIGISFQGISRTAQRFLEIWSPNNRHLLIASNWAQTLQERSIAPSPEGHHPSQERADTGTTHRIPEQTPIQQSAELPAQQPKPMRERPSVRSQEPVHTTPSKPKSSKKPSGSRRQQHSRRDLPASEAPKRQERQMPLVVFGEASHPASIEDDSLNRTKPDAAKNMDTSLTPAASADRSDLHQPDQQTTHSANPGDE